MLKSVISEQKQSHSYLLVVTCILLKGLWYLSIGFTEHINLVVLSFFLVTTVVLVVLHCSSLLTDANIMES